MQNAARWGRLTIRRLSLILVCGLWSGQIAAQDTVPAPEYFVAAAMETSTAQILARSCETVSIHPGRMSERTESVLQRLTEDGFTPENLETRMQDPSDAIAVLQQAFLDKHGLQDGAATEVVCAAAFSEIEEGTPIGALLIGLDE